jgi:LysM repeat protein
MNTREYYKTLPVLLLYLVITLQSAAQVVVERSKDKVIISGTAYYMHQVKKGETAWSVSKAYGITVEELTKENPPALYGINEGQLLRIPYRDVPENQPEQMVPVKSSRDDSKYIYHTLQPGETVYALSRLYGVSENEITSANQGIDINKLPVGAEIAVPRREFMTSRYEFVLQEKTPVFHKVLRGESLSSIAEQYGVTLRELRRENRNIRFPQVGDYIRIPVIAKQKTEVPDLLLADSLPITAEPHELLSIPSAYTPVENLKGSMNIAVLLPFYLEENDVRADIDSSNIVKGKRTYKTISRPDEWIYPRSIGFIEMYEGILLAADTLRSLGVDINFHVYDIGSDTIKLTRLILEGKLAGMDLIIGPVYSYNLTAVASYAGRLGIPVVSPVPLMNNSVLIDHPTLFMANSSLKVAQNAISEKITEYYNDNFVFIHADTAGIDPGIKYFKNKLLSELSTRLPYEEIKFKEFLFYTRSVFNNDSINRLAQTLSEDYGNVVILASEADPVISESLMDLHTLSKEYQIKIFGYSAMRGLDNLDPKYLFDLDILMFTPYWIDYSRQDVRNFNSDFRNKFFTEPGELSYAWQGYDIAYYFISGLAIHGRDFILHPEIHNPDLLQTRFDFRRKTWSNGFENQNLYLIRYTKDYDIDLVSETEQIQNW